MPVGRIEYHHLGPMTFREFLLAVDPALLAYLDALDFDTPPPEAAHRKLSQRHRQYLFVGGMPEAVLAFAESTSLEEAGAVHRRIVSTYEDDFAKYARHRDLMRLQRVFRMIPRQVGHKVKYVNFSRDDLSRDIRHAIELLEKARICTRVFASHCGGVPLMADIDESAYKLLFLDVGLMNHLCGVDWMTLSRMVDVQLVNEGAVAEQVVGQHLAYPGQGTHPPQVVYWLREGRKANAEVDYVVASGPDIFPVEVKAGRSGTLRSLHQFVATGKAAAAVRFDTNPPSRQRVVHQVPVAGKQQEISVALLSLPLYAVGELSRLLVCERERRLPPL